MKCIMSGGEGEEKVDARRRMVGGEGVRAREEMKYSMSGAKKRRKKWKSPGERRERGEEEEKEVKKEKLDPKKLILYSEIMKPKFDE